MRGRYRQRKRLWQQPEKWRQTHATYVMASIHGRPVYLGELEIQRKRYRFKKGVRTYSKKPVDPGRAARQFERGPVFRGQTRKIDGWGQP